MRKINKTDFSSERFNTWIRDNPNNRYKDLTWEIRCEIREHCTKEQFFLCAYCCKRIRGGDDTVNEHIKPQDHYPNDTLNVNDNIVASCKSPNQCDSAHGNQIISLTPLMSECETELEYRINGTVKGLTPRAEEMIRVINLGDSIQNNKKLIAIRKSIIDTILFDTHGIEKLELEDKNILLLLVEEISQPDHNEELLEYSPIIINIINQYL